ncbi:MAG: flagellar hook assembly protein FlgD, partial [Candidatus Poribacteria bacterium]
MNINVVKTTGAVYDAEQNKPKLGEKLGKEDFLKLLITQLRYQDPTKPMSNEQFIAQTAEFSSLEQMQEMNSNIRAFIESQQKIGKASALSLIGKNVTVNKSAFSLSSDKSSASLTYSLPKEAEVTITIFDSLNKAIRNVDLGKQSAGTHSYLWDGKTNQNSNAGKGDYSYKITARGID